MNANLKKAAEMLKNDDALAEKLGAEAERLAETMQGKEANEILAQAIRNTLGIDLTAADLASGKSDARDLSPEQMGKVAGGDSGPEDYAEMLKEFFERLFG